jgi:hypothetical protein
MISFAKLGQMGRLGNQLFQIATTIALALRNNDKYVFPYWEEERNFNLHNCFSHITNTEIFMESDFTYNPIPYKQNLNIQGFFQSEKYFEDCQNVIHHLLTPKIGFGIKYGYTSIHVRKGDYVNLIRQYEQLNMSYYQKAMQVINSKYYIVFSDDIAWCKANFKGNNFTFSEGRSAAEDLALMLSCEHNIVANSSFSWWGAWLNKNPSKVVIAPQKWFGPAMPHNTKDLLPKTWVQI